MKRLFMIAVAVLAAVLILGFVKDMAVKVSVEKGVALVTGLKLRIASFRVGVLRTLVDIKGLELFNPAGFRDRIMLNMPEIYINYDLPSIIKGKVHLPEARINLEEFVVVKNEKGELNLNALKVVQAQKEGKKPAERAGGKPPKIEIDSLTLKIGRVVYKDYSGGGKPVIKEFDINLDENYKNIDDAYSLVSLIVVRAMMNTTIPDLTNFDLKGLQGTVSGAFLTAQKVTTESVTKAQAVAKQSVQTVTETAKKTEAVVEETTGVLKDILKNPFGSK